MVEVVPSTTVIWWRRRDVYEAIGREVGVLESVEVTTAVVQRDTTAFCDTYVVSQGFAAGFPGRIEDGWRCGLTDELEVQPFRCRH